MRRCILTFFSPFCFFHYQNISIRAQAARQKQCTRQLPITNRGDFRRATQGGEACCKIKQPWATIMNRGDWAPFRRATQGGEACCKIKQPWAFRYGRGLGQKVVKGAGPERFKLKSPADQGEIISYPSLRSSCIRE